MRFSPYSTQNPVGWARLSGHPRVFLDLQLNPDELEGKLDILLILFLTD